MFMSLRILGQADEFAEQLILRDDGITTELVRFAKATKFLPVMVIEQVNACAACAIKYSMKINLAA